MIEETWIRVRDELRKQRGHNQFRGREDHLLPKKQIRVEKERRKDGASNGEIWIHLTETEPDLWAESFPEEKKIYLKEFGNKLDDFIAEILRIARGDNPYLKTNSEEAEYR